MAGQTSGSVKKFCPSDFLKVKPFFASSERTVFISDKFIAKLLTNKLYRRKILFAINFC